MMRHEFSGEIEIRGIAYSGIGIELKITAVGFQGSETGLGHEFTKMIAPVLHERRKGKIMAFVLKEAGHGDLDRTVTAKSVELMNLAEFIHKPFRRYTLAHFPAVAMENLSEGKAPETSFK